MSTEITITGQKGFLLWMKANQPKLYNEFRVRMRENSNPLQGLGQSVYDAMGISASPDPAATATSAPASQSWIDSIKNLFTGAAQIYLTKNQLDAQNKILDTQLSRARAGLPPLDIDVSRYGLQPTVGVNLGASTQNLLMWGVVALAAVFLLPKLLAGLSKR
jgi:hypothetical protein